MSAEDPKLGESAEENPAADEDFLPELNCFFLSGSRHDRDRIEIQIGFDGVIPDPADRSFQYIFDCVLFVPKSVGLTEVEDSEHLRQEFQSYIRLHTHAANPKNESSLNRVKERLQQLKDHLSIDTLRVFAIDFESYLKGQTRRVKHGPQRPDSISAEIELIEFLVKEFRWVLKARGLESRNSEDFPRGSMDHDLLLLNEYLSHLFAQYLVETRYSCGLSSEMSAVIPNVERAIQHEAQMRRLYKFLIEESDGTTSSTEEELYPRRIGLLKKYFQKSIFVHVTGHSLQRRIAIPANGMAAAMAASWAIMVQLYQARTVAERVGINSIALLSIGVFAYAIKDFLKENLKKAFYRTGSRWFPDYEKKLYHRRGEKEYRLGVIREYLRAFDSERLPQALREARYSVRGGEMEEYLHEDILHFKKRVTLDLSELDSREQFPWGLREILRYRFDRMLHSMEDPFKNIHLVSTTGTPVTRQAHRIYHIYLAAWIRAEDPPTQNKTPVRPAFKAFRITLDKTGVLDCQRVDWDHGRVVPNPP